MERSVTRPTISWNQCRLGANQSTVKRKGIIKTKLTSWDKSLIMLVYVYIRNNDCYEFFSLFRDLFAEKCREFLVLVNLSFF